MCDENIAVSIRTLNQMSSIIPNRMEKLKLASLSAGIVAGFTTDCSYGDDLSLMRGYDTLVAPRVESLSHVLRSYIVLNKTWYNTGAQSISNIRNIFITGRKHPVNTIKNAFAIISKVESNQNNIEGDMTLFHGLYILNQYGIDLDAPFYRLLESTREKGLLHTVKAFREHVIKTAKRITKDGTRLDILDDSKLEVITSVMTGLIMGYCEPLPTTTVDFNQYYATAAYPYGLSLLNELVEKLTVNTDLIFNTYRSTLETRYELSYEPVATVRGVLALLMGNNILAEDMSKSIDTSNKEELLDYIVGMVKGVYDVRKSAAEREVLHDLDFLPVNPIHELVNVPESPEELSKRMEEMVASVESLLNVPIVFDEAGLRKIKTVSIERLNGRQITGLAMVVLGGAMMAWAVYYTFFKQTATLAKKTSDYHEQAQKHIDQINKDLANAQRLRQVNAEAFKKQLEETSKRLKLSPALQNTSLVDSVVANKVSEAVAKQLGSGTKVEDMKLPVIKYTMTGNLGAEQPDLSKSSIKEQLSTFVLYQKAIANNELESHILPEKFKTISSVEQFDKYISETEVYLKRLSKDFAPRPWTNKTGKEITQDQLFKYIKINLLDKQVSDQLENCAKFAEANTNRVSSIDYEARSKEYEEIIKSSIPNISDEDLKECLISIRDLNKNIQTLYRRMGDAFIWFQKNVMAWDQLAVKHMHAIKIINDTFKTDPKTGKIIV